MAAASGKLACPGVPLLEMLLHFRRREIGILLCPASKDEHEFRHVDLLAGTTQARRTMSVRSNRTRPRRSAGRFSSRRNESPRTASVQTLSQFAAHVLVLRL